MICSSTRWLVLIWIRAAPARLRVRHLPLDALDQAEPDAVRGDQQRAVLRLPGVAGQHVEQVGEVGADLRVGGEQADVLVQARGLVVVVAGADVGVALELATLLPHDQCGLAVRLQPDQAVDDVAAGALQRSGPLDVGLLVEPGLDLDQDDDLLALLGRVDEGVDDGRVTRRPVQGLLDGQHVRVDGGLFDEALHAGGERLVRVVDEHVGLAQGGEERAGRLALGQARMGGWNERRFLQRGAVDPAVDLP